MKKSAIALAVFAAALFAVSCQKETTPEQKSGPMTISAVTEGIGVGAKAAMVYKYDVVWKTGDRICVKNSEKSVEFTLTGGEETTKGTFSSGESISGDVEGFYPSSIVTDGGLVWPAEQGSKQICPMYCKKTLSSTQNQTFNFASLGSVLQLNFNSTTAGIVLKSIEVKADEAMSGAFTVENGQAKVSQPEGDKPGITLDLGEGLALGTSAKKFNIAVPAGKYHGLSIVLTATNGKKCIINAKKDKAIEIVYNTVNTLAISGEFKVHLPAGTLPGVFTVSNDNGTTKTQIYFSQGNLWYGKVGDAQTATFQFEANQYDFQSSWSTSHVSHFFWSKTASVAYAESYSESGKADTDVFFTNATAETAKSDFTVNGVTGKYRTLSIAEWQYLFNTRKMENDGARFENLTSSGITVEGVTFKGIVLFPDDFTEQTTWKETYTTWKALNDAGLVFLPAASRRNDSGVENLDEGFYWSSTADTSAGAFGVSFNSLGVQSSTVSGYNRNRGFSVRLIFP